MFGVRLFSFMLLFLYGLLPANAENVAAGSAQIRQNSNARAYHTITARYDGATMNIRLRSTEDHGSTLISTDQDATVQLWQGQFWLNDGNGNRAIAGGRVNPGPSWQLMAELMLDFQMAEDTALDRFSPVLAGIQHDPHLALAEFFSGGGAVIRLYGTNSTALPRRDQYSPRDAFGLIAHDYIVVVSETQIAVGFPQSVTISRLPSAFVARNRSEPLRLAASTDALHFETIGPELGLEALGHSRGSIEDAFFHVCPRFGSCGYVAAQSVEMRAPIWITYDRATLQPLYIAIP